MAVGRTASIVQIIEKGITNLYKDKRCKMTHTYYEVIDTPISIEEVTNKVIRRECGAVTTFIGMLENLRKVDVHFV